MGVAQADCTESLLWVAWLLPGPSLWRNRCFLFPISRARALSGSWKLRLMSWQMAGLVDSYPAPLQKVTIILPLVTLYESPGVMRLIVIFLGLCITWSACLFQQITEMKFASLVGLMKPSPHICALITSCRPPVRLNASLSSQDGQLVDTAHSFKFWVFTRIEKEIVPVISYSLRLS